MKKGLYILLIAICSLQFVAKAQQEELKPWIDVVMDERDPSQWKWNKTDASRFTIRGDFDGDGFSENLYETATSIFSDNDELTPLKLAEDLGVYFLINEGDLDGDGGDEISFMIVNRDYSNLNYFRIWTYKDTKWKELFSVLVHEYDCPNYKATRPEEMFTHQWKRKNGYNMNKIVLKVCDGVVDVIGFHPCERYAIEHVKLVDKTSAKREWGVIIQPREEE